MLEKWKVVGCVHICNCATLCLSHVAREYYTFVRLKSLVHFSPLLLNLFGMEERY